MDNTDILQEMLIYIDTHIKEKMNVEVLAKRAGFSPIYFCRIFQNVVGTSIMEYVRNRRLAYAASELNSGRKLSNIAKDYSFETHSGFSKAFRRFFGCPPEVYRTYAYFNVPEIQDLTKSKQHESNNIIEPKIMAKKAAFKIAGFAQKYSFKVGVKLDEIYKIKTEYIEDGRMDKLHGESFIKHHAEYGISFTKDSEDDNAIFVVGLEVKSKNKIPAEYSVFYIPDSLYAVFTTTTSIADTWQYIFNEWLPNSGYEYCADGIPFEFFNGRSIIDPVCDIYIPVVRIQL